MGMKERADGICSNSLKFFALLSQTQIRFSSNKRKHSIPPQNIKKNKNTALSPELQELIPNQSQLTLADYGIG